jgi:hypothetical protein
LLSGAVEVGEVPGVPAPDEYEPVCDPAAEWVGA